MTAHLMNCPHSEEGWCLSCLKAEWDRWDVITSERFQHEKMVVHDMNSPDHLEPKACAECAAKDREIAELKAKLKPLESNAAMRAEWAKQSLENNTGKNKIPRTPIFPDDIY